MTYRRHTQNGFTLIELLLVIAIIGIISSVGLAALGRARISANNTDRSEDVRAYANAAEIYYANARAYPGATTAYRCLGMASGQTCWGGAVSGDDTLRTHFDGAFTGTPPSGNLQGLSDNEGYLYGCTNASCQGYSMTFMLQRAGESCGAGAVTVDSDYASAYTYCQLIKCHIGTSPARSAGATSLFTCQ